MGISLQIFTTIKSLNNTPVNKLKMLNGSLELKTKYLKTRKSAHTQNKLKNHRSITFKITKYFKASQLNKKKSRKCFSNEILRIMRRKSLNGKLTPNYHVSKLEESSSK